MSSYQTADGRDVHDLTYQEAEAELARIMEEAGLTFIFGTATRATREGMDPHAATVDFVLWTNDGTKALHRGSYSAGSGKWPRDLLAKVRAEGRVGPACPSAAELSDVAEGRRYLQRLTLHDEEILLRALPFWTPAPVDVFLALLNDAADFGLQGSGLTFREWSDMMGSGNAADQLDAYNACRATYDALRAALGSDDLERAVIIAGQC